MTPPVLGKSIVRYRFRPRNLPKARHRNQIIMLAISLFLLGLSLVSLRLRALLAYTNKAGLGARVSEFPVCVLLALVLANGTFLEFDNVLDWQSSSRASNDLLTGLGG